MLKTYKHTTIFSQSALQIQSFSTNQLYKYNRFQQMNFENYHFVINLYRNFKSSQNIQVFSNTNKL